MQISGLEGKLEDAALEHDALARVNEVLNHGLGEAQHQVRLHFASICHLQALATQARERGKHWSLARRVLGWWVSYRHVVHRLTQASLALSRRRQAERAQRAFAAWSTFLSQLCTMHDCQRQREAAVVRCFRRFLLRVGWAGLRSEAGASWHLRKAWTALRLKSLVLVSVSHCASPRAFARLACLSALSVIRVEPALHLSQLRKHPSWSPRLSLCMCFGS
jgi:hypothetical protein